MKREIEYGVYIPFRVSSVIATAVRERAESAGTTTSEVIRRFLIAGLDPKPESRFITKEKPMNSRGG